MFPTSSWDTKFGGTGGTHKFEAHFQHFADAVRHGLLIPWSLHQASLVAHGEALDDFETLRAHFDRWVERYNESLHEQLDNEAAGLEEGTVEKNATGTP